ncbi:MAG: alpha/beta fold hydrolase [Pseudomonadota bacterium]
MRDVLATAEAGMGSMDEDGLERIGDLDVRLVGPRDGAPVLFLHSIGTGHRVWDGVVPHLPPGVRAILPDLRGHGGSAAMTPGQSMRTLVGDVAQLLAGLRSPPCLVVGLSLGGMIAQGLAAERGDLVRAMVLMSTGAKIGTRAVWEQRIEAIRAEGLSAQADGILDRWFPPRFHAAEAATVAMWRDRLLATEAESYCAACAAIAETDLFESTSRLRLPTLGLVGTADPVTPPDLVREAVDLIPGSQFALLRGAGHLPPIDKPAEVAAAVNGFMVETGHLLAPHEPTPPRLT